VRRQQAERRALVIEEEVQEVYERIRKLLDACDEWLTDPKQPEKYTLDPRAREIQVVYSDLTDLDSKGNPRRKRDTLSNLLALLAGAKVEPRSIHVRQADPRELILKAAAEMKGLMELYGRLKGLFQRDRKNDDDIKREEARQEYAKEALREVMEGMGLSESEARKWMEEHTPKVAKYLM
jgi:hypothetical protein